MYKRATHDIFKKHRNLHAQELQNDLLLLSQKHFKMQFINYFIPKMFYAACRHPLHSQCQECRLHVLRNARAYLQDEGRQPG